MVGDVQVGGGAPVSVQSMTNTPTSDIASTLSLIDELADAGCDIVRVGVPDSGSADSLTAIVRGSRLPVIADIHFDHELALAALDAGVAGIRINPGTLASDQKVREVARAAAAADLDRARWRPAERRGERSCVRQPGQPLRSGGQRACLGAG